MYSLIRMWSKKRSAAHSMVVALTLAAATQCAQGSVIAQSTFDVDASGWTGISFKANVNDDHPVFTKVVQTYGVTYSATGGNPGGTINEVDQDSGWQYFAAPSSFLGNESAAFGGMLSFQLMRTDANVDFPPQTGIPLAITDGTTILVFAPASLKFPVNNGWATYLFNLSADGNVFVSRSDGQVATPLQVSTVLSNLTGLFILADWYTGTGDAYDLDNVVLSTAPIVPEPATFELMIAAGLLIAARYRKR